MSDYEGMLGECVNPDIQMRLSNGLRLYGVLVAAGSEYSGVTEFQVSLRNHCCRHNFILL